MTRRKRYAVVAFSNGLVNAYNNRDEARFEVAKIQVKNPSIRAKFITYKEAQEITGIKNYSWLQNNLAWWARSHQPMSNQ